MLSATDALSTAIKLLGRLEARRPAIEEYDDYYEGKHPLKFASREWSDFHKDQYTGFSDNWCGVIPDAANERLQIKSIAIPDADSRFESELWRAWLNADMQAKSSQGFLQTMVAERSFVSVWGDSNGTPIVAWEHPSQVYVDLHPLTGERRFAIKSYVDDGREYLTLVTPEWIWKWSRKANVEKDQKGIYTINGVVIPDGTSTRKTLEGGGWEAYQPRDDDTWPLQNVLGEVYFVEVPNRPRLKRGAMSDISGAMAMQDAINLLWNYLFGAADHASLPARVVMGQAPPKIPILNKEGQKIGEETVPIEELQRGRILWLTGQETSIGQWDSANLETFTQVIEIAIGHISSQVRVPAHYFVANTGLSNINGETLTATETPLVKKVEEFHLFTSGPMRDVLRLMAKVMNMDAVAPLITSGSISWVNASIRSESQMADALSKKRSMGYPLEYLLELDGLPKEDIERVMQMARAEQLDPYAIHLNNKAESAQAVESGDADE